LAEFHSTIDNAGPTLDYLNRLPEVAARQ